MKFDVVLGNPPYNKSSASSKTIAGTSGNTTLYKSFIRKGFELCKEDGTLALVVQRNGIKYAIENFNVSKFDVDTSEVWKFTAGYFIATGNDNTQQDLTNDPIINKTYSLASSRRFTSAIGGSYAANKDKGYYSQDPLAGIYGLVNTPTSDTGPVFAHITVRAKPAGPKLVFKGLESKKSYYVTDKPVHVGSGCILYFDSLAEAEAARKFILYNPIMTYLYKKLSEKALGFVFRYVKPFDLTQITTGKEIPSEFGLTFEEIEYLEQYC